MDYWGFLYCSSSQICKGGECVYLPYAQVSLLNMSLLKCTALFACQSKKKKKSPLKPKCKSVIRQILQQTELLKITRIHKVIWSMVSQGTVEELKESFHG